MDYFHLGGISLIDVSRELGVLSNSELLKNYNIEGNLGIDVLG